MERPGYGESVGTKRLPCLPVDFYDNAPDAAELRRRVHYLVQPVQQDTPRGAVFYRTVEINLCGFVPYFHAVDYSCTTFPVRNAL